MPESELNDPYLTPRTVSLRRPYKYLTYAIILAVILSTVAAASLMVWWSIRPMRLELDRGPAIEYRGPSVEINRGPVERTIGPPANSSDTVAP